MAQFGRWLVVLGVAAVVIGLGLMAWDRLGLPRVQLLRLPGDIVVEREKFRLYIPIVTSIVLSVILTVLFNIFRK